MLELPEVETIKCIKHSGRSSFFCPKCQQN
ncbi:hypothetical protein COW98_03970 [Candidatus Roizmanbacteria bacterium CG22_combo_CG10-13_8_21_14_all_35_9]|uniref:Zinc finger FPG/IleRS-type domain-containing protein n=3 Tax=Candidatus Roizmaniibacteriota TaxID=1752723 RepID=A0A2M8F1W1_9BACT|nr:MAG: hypothetical protein COX47_02705 [Candidatus Roizmanbacteria bacterium CG23_combo_of_CG06-09_8_20_14_all_35_49]PIP62449.1 MAG: hypothetical protein COW98_03970 [Candidatus Roizmanbacteria bacterium CG22_combo_CG10-13_8_21_14_all_35_9]PJC33279.1 MAG: hypothetical protein CO048_03440 [Candidatus Roizmanbacteria bacterium CG_4_9_14_0_2_um_filter_35_15]PJC82925.1 MAG: hypothetical protein CO006_01080 [Candidatus Roizmanbacteria bacterium CG_4_8_14_3_um_filter_35_14]